MDKKNWLVLFVIMILSAGLLITVMPVSAASTSAPTVKENPYEHWIEPSELKNCSIQCLFGGLYISSDGTSHNGSVGLNLNFDKGNWNSTTHTFEAENNGTIKPDRRIPFSEKDTGYLLRRCKLVLDPGMNKIERFEFFSREERTDDRFYRSTKRIVNVTGVELPRSAISRIDLGSMVFLSEQKNKTCFASTGEKIKNSVKSINDRIIRKIDGKTRSSEESRCDNVDSRYYLYITFDGYLPKLPAHKGKCSWFGGKNDTGIDVTLREEFYKKYVWGPYKETVFKEDKEINRMFEEDWMPPRRSRWEGTGLQCGYARELDTENDYFCAMRWHDKETEDYNSYGKPGHQHWWREQKIKVTNTENNMSVIVAPVDWGPHVDTGRVIDLSKKAIETLGANTDTTIVEMCLVDSDTPLGPVTNP